jgi:molybdopterin synthase catalytic subunit
VPRREDDWTELSAEALPVEAITTWATRPDCGAVVTFLGTVRDHAEGRPGVTELEYEAYEEHVVGRLDSIIAEARARWPLGRVALLHRTGRLLPTECSVVVTVSAGHRGEAFEAARFCIDTLKSTVPVWKSETWSGGTDWGLEARPVEEAGAGGTGSGAEVRAGEAGSA